MAWPTVCHEYGFRILTREGEVLNVYVDAVDVYGAQFKVQEQYPGCRIVSDIQMRIM